MKKRGLGNVFATVMIILLVVVATSVIYLAIIPMLNSLDGRFDIFKNFNESGGDGFSLDTEMVGEGIFDCIGDVCVGNVSSCGELNRPNTFYYLSQNIVNNDLSDNCITIAARGIKLDCNGYGIRSDDNFAGIYTDQQDGVISGCDIDMGDGGTGIIAENAYNSVISNNALTGQGTGIFVRGGYNISILDNLIVANDGVGINILDTNWINVTENEAYDNLEDIVLVNSYSISGFNNIFDVVNSPFREVVPVTTERIIKRGMNENTFSLNVPTARYSNPAPDTTGWEGKYLLFEKGCEGASCGCIRQEVCAPILEVVGGCHYQSGECVHYGGEDALAPASQYVGACALNDKFHVYDTLQDCSDAYNAWPILDVHYQKSICDNETAYCNLDLTITRNIVSLNSGSPSEYRVDLYIRTNDDLLSYILTEDYSEGVSGVEIINVSHGGVWNTSQRLGTKSIEWFADDEFSVLLTGGAVVSYWINLPSQDIAYYLQGRFTSIDIHGMIENGTVVGETLI